MPAYTTENIRNIALLGSAGAGKTTLIETMLHEAGVIGRIGRVEDGTTVSDYEDLEKESKHSLDSAVVYFDRGGAHFNVIDTPGAGDFMGKAIGVIPAVETAVIVVDAGGIIDPIVRRLMKLAAERGVARMIVVNKIDHAPDLAEFVETIQDAFGGACRPVNVPVNGGKAVVDCFTTSSGTSDLGDVSDFHTGLVEQIVEVDEALMEQYLESGDVSADKLEGAFKQALREGSLVPMFFAAARDNVGVREVTDFIAKRGLSPLEGKPVQFVYVKDGQRTTYSPKADPAKPLVAHVFKVASDPYVGKLSVFRVHQGTASPASNPRIDGGRKGVRIAHVFHIRGRDHAETTGIIAGDIGAVAKIDEIDYNSTLHSGDIAEDLRIDPIPMPKPMFGLAVEGTSKGAETKLVESLRKLVAEDPTLAIDRVQATGQTVLRGLGEQHLRIKLRMLKDRYGVEVATHPPKVAYKETVTTKADGHHRHKKQTGGAGQFGEVYLRVEPIKGNEEGVDHGLLFVDDTFGGSIPKQFLPAVEKGVRRVMSEGAIAGYPMHNVKVSVYDGKYHAVDSKEVAFVTAGRKAFVDAVQKAKPVLLEPYVKMEITVPARLIGDISSDLSGRRGRILGTDMLPGDQAIVTAEAPLSEVMSYASQLKSITGGAGSYTIEYSHDERTPPNVQAEVVAAYKPRAEEE
jgi:elongation factor G